MPTLGYSAPRTARCWSARVCAVASCSGSYGGRRGESACRPLRAPSAARPRVARCCSRHSSAAGACAPHGPSGLSRRASRRAWPRPALTAPAARRARWARRAASAPRARPGRRHAVAIADRDPMMANCHLADPSPPSPRPFCTQKMENALGGREFTRGAWQCSGRPGGGRLVFRSWERREGR